MNSITLQIFISTFPLCLGILLDLVLGDPYRLPHPIRWIGALIGWLDGKLRRGTVARQRRGGVWLVLIVTGISTILPTALLVTAYRVNPWLGIAVEGICDYYLLAATSLRRESSKVYRALKAGDVEAARRAVSMIVGRDTERLDADDITRAAVETVAENTSDGVTAPLFFICLGGAVGGFFYKSVNTMDSMVGYHNEKYEYFGKCAARLDDVLNFVPARLTALLMIVASYLLHYDGKNAYRIWKRDRRRHASPNSAQTESACAGALRIRLAGDAWYFGELHHKEYLGDDLRPIEPEDIRRTNRLMYLTSALMAVIAVLARAGTAALLL